MNQTKAPKTKRRRKNERNAALFDDETVEFIQAVDAYRRRYDRSFPAWSEVLSIVKALGYRKVAPPTDVFGETPVEEPVSAVDTEPVDPLPEE